MSRQKKPFETQKLKTYKILSKFKGRIEENFENKIV